MTPTARQGRRTYACNHFPLPRPASFPGFSAAGANPSRSSGGSTDLNSNTDASNPDLKTTGFADLLASTQPAESTDSTDVKSDTASTEPKKEQAPNLLLACFLPTVAPTDLSQNENPLSFDLGESPTSPEPQAESTDLDARPQLVASSAAFRFLDRDSQASTVDEGAADLNNQSPTAAGGAAELLPLPAASPASPETAQDLAFKFEFVASNPRITPDAKKPAVAVENSHETAPEIASDVTTEKTSELSPQNATDLASVEAAAKIAPAPPRFGRASFSAHRRSEIKFLSPDQSQVTKAPQTVGTAVAKSTEDHMPTLFKNNLRSDDSFAISHVALATAASTTVDLPAAESASAPTAKSAVAQVVAVMDAEAHETATANLKMDFDFGDARLTVRVEMRDGTLQAHFHTDSAALQSSLSREWHVAAAAEPEKFVRFAEPSFNNSSAQNSFSGQSQGDARRNSSQTTDAREEANSLGSLFRRSRSTASPFAPMSTPVSPSLFSLSQLNTFA